MHSFTIISWSEKQRSSQREKILNQFKVPSFQRIILGASNQSIKAIKEAQKLLYYSTHHNQKQALIILSLEKFSLVAQQSLLKTIEEPPINTIIILEAQNQEQILPTILSRSQVIFLPDRPVLNLSQEKEITQFWQRFLTKNTLVHRLNQASSLVKQIKKRDNLIIWLDQQIIFFHSLLRKKLTTSAGKGLLTLSDLTKILKLLIWLKKQTLNNINLKLLMDYFFLNLPSGPTQTQR